MQPVQSPAPQRKQRIRRSDSSEDSTAYDDIIGNIKAVMEEDKKTEELDSSD
jgi:hypothetical protein